MCEVGEFRSWNFRRYFVITFQTHNSAKHLKMCTSYTLKYLIYYEAYLFSPESANSQILKHRRVKHYGYEFIYGINNVDRDKPLNEGIPITCEELLTELVNSHHISCRPDQLTVNQYLPGQGEIYYLFLCSLWYP